MFTWKTRERVSMNEICLHLVINILLGIKEFGKNLLFLYFCGFFSMIVLFKKKKNQKKRLLAFVSTGLITRKLGKDYFLLGILEIGKNRDF